ncbi:hypothetical protein LTS18_009268 [Coniosporium uncinatum]|uniref:Uncharacterized protein n=1 Tax=Coniosporium uncinatum TaxID=93489 RepID=A0ACC3DD26_9PEZI|nr:hypothetical protein LTS18_009268 [Coniosporium uncinatum]
MPPLPPQREKRIVGTSLKMYFDLPTTQSYIAGVAELDDLAASQNVDLFVIPDFVSIVPSEQALRGTAIMLGAQDCMWEASGAFTGEVSPLTLRQAGVKIVEMGHAERRRLFGESDESVAKKAAACAAQGLVPLVCVGEVQKPRSPSASQAVGQAVEEVKGQVMSALRAVPGEAEVVLAYEPVWAIGASQPADADHVVGVTTEIRRMAAEMGRRGRVRVLYGGSAGPGTFERIKDGVDGLFLGRFAHDLGNLKKVIEEIGAA